MSHLIEVYAKDLGVKIGKPVLVEHFFPVKDEKYITVHTDNKIDSKNYEYFPQVLNLLRPILQKHGYKIYQIGGPEDPRLKQVDEHFLNLTYKQSIHVIKNSKLHLGIDSLPVHIASVFDIPIVVLYSHIYANHARPYWSSPERVRVLESDKKGNKPSYGYSEHPKTIRSITPEQVAAQVFDLLGFEIKIPMQTISIGSVFHREYTEVVPNFRANISRNDDSPIYVRADLFYDEQNILFWVSNNRSCIVTDRGIHIDTLRQCAANIHHIYFKLNDENAPSEYFMEVKRLKIPFTICTTEKDKLAVMRNAYFDFRVEYDDWKERAEKVEKKGQFFMTNKVILSNSVLFPSEAHLRQNKPLDGHNEVLDDIHFWKDYEHYLIYDDTRFTTPTDSTVKSVSDSLGSNETNEAPATV